AVSLAVTVIASAMMFFHTRISATSPFVGVKDFYLGLGDSLAFGFQPNFDFSHGYVYQWYADLQQQGSRSRTDYGCNGETTTTFILGGCPAADLVHDTYPPYSTDAPYPAGGARAAPAPPPPLPPAPALPPPPPPPP